MINLFRFFIFINVLTLCCWSMFTFDEMKEILYFAEAAFCPPNSERGIMNWKCFWCQKLQKTNITLDNIHYFKHTESQLLVYGGTYKKENGETRLIVSFRGTVDPVVDLLSFLLDLDWKKIPNPFSKGKGKISQGFYEGYKFIENGFIGIFEKIWESSGQDISDIILTGHSLGAAATFFGAVSLVQKFPQVERLRDEGKLILMNYGSPRIGDTEFTKFFHDEIVADAQVYRVTYENDLAVHCPFEKELAYHHISREYWFPWNKTRSSQEPSFVKCNGSGEDEECADSVKFYDLSMVKHFEYLGVDWIEGTKPPYFCADNGNPAFDQSIRGLGILIDDVIISPRGESNFHALENVIKKARS